MRGEVRAGRRGSQGVGQLGVCTMPGGRCVMPSSSPWTATFLKQEKKSFMPG